MTTWQALGGVTAAYTEQTSMSEPQATYETEQQDFADALIESTNFKSPKQVRQCADWLLVCLHEAQAEVKRLKEQCISDYYDGVKDGATRVHDEVIPLITDQYDALIAAAPDLLAACEELLISPWSMAAVDRAKAAIAKARGVV